MRDQPIAVVAIALSTLFCFFVAVDIKNEGETRAERLWALFCGLCGVYALIP